MTVNWKQAAKWYREQFLLWARAYNEIADIYMIEESLSAGNPYSATVHLTRRVPDRNYVGAKLKGLAQPVSAANPSPLDCSGVNYGD